MEKVKLNVKDFVVIGVISAIAAVLFMVIGTIMGSTPVGWVFMHSVLAIPFGVLYMLLYSKVPKKGVVLMGGLIIMLLQLMNNWLIPSIMLIIYIINELIWRSGSQKKFSKMVVAFTIFMTGWAVASFAPILVLKDTYIAQFGDRAAYFEQMQKAISRLVRGRTVMMIAHRLKTVVKADNIIVLESGKVAEQGTHAELLKKYGLYARLWELQMKTSGWRISAY